jgi:hypothetical protein
VPLRNRVCGANQTCNPALNRCQCQGCQVGGTCAAPGPNPTNPCQVCDPSRSTTAFSANAGALCGAGPSTCSGQDTCNAQGQCAPNNFAFGMICAGGVCQGDGQCRALTDGSPCTGDAQCATGRCTTFFRDLDGDNFGSQSDTMRVCGTVPPIGFFGFALIVRQRDDAREMPAISWLTCGFPCLRVLTLTADDPSKTLGNF